MRGLLPKYADGSVDPSTYSKAGHGIAHLLPGIEEDKGGIGWKREWESQDLSLRPCLKNKGKKDQLGGAGRWILREMSDIWEASPG